MPIRVCLHHGHDAGRLGNCPHDADVVADRLKVDDGGTLRETRKAV
jgi:hypothetical protein